MATFRGTQVSLRGGAAGGLWALTDHVRRRRAWRLVAAALSGRLYDWAQPALSGAARAR